LFINSGFRKHRHFTRCVSDLISQTDCALRMMGFVRHNLACVPPQSIWQIQRRFVLGNVCTNRHDRPSLKLLRELQVRKCFLRLDRMAHSVICRFNRVMTHYAINSGENE